MKQPTKKEQQDKAPLKQYTIRISQEDRDQIERLAEKEQRKEADLARIALKIGLKNIEAKRRSL